MMDFAEKLQYDALMNHLNETLTELELLQLRCARLEMALEKAKQFAVCNCPEDEVEGRVIYHSNCQRRLRPILDAALASD